MLYGTLNGTCAKLGAITLFGQEIHSTLAHVHRDVVILQTLLDGRKLQFDYFAYLTLVQRSKRDDFIYTIQEFGPHRLEQLLAGVVAGHYYQGVLEIHRTPLGIRQATVIQNLQQGVEDIRMSLLNLVEQYHAVRLAAYSLGQLTALVIPYISWRRTYQTGYAELLLILAHVDTRHHLLVVKQIVSQRTRQFGLAYTRSTQEYERAYRSLRVLKSCTAAAHGITHGTYSLVLTDYTLVQFSLQVQQFLTFGSLHLGNRNTRPARNYFGNILARNLLAQQLPHAHDARPPPSATAAEP